MSPGDSTVLEQLATISPPDWSGSTAANRFQFQISWAICRILELHATDQSYAVILDLHDDVVELDDEVAPTQIDFHQVKSRANGNWTLAKLVYRAKGKAGLKPSILGKLATHRSTFGSCVRQTCFVSNRPSNLNLKDGKKAADVERFSLADTDHSTKQNIEEAIQLECGAKPDESSAKSSVFVQTTLTPGDHENQSRGRIADFLERHRDRRMPTNPVYRSLKAELERRNNSERLPVASADLSKQKLFGRSHMEQILQLASPKETLTELLAEIESSLAAEGISFQRRKLLRLNCERVCLDRLDASNTLLSRIAEFLKGIYVSWLNTDRDESSLLDGVDYARSTISNDSYKDFVAAYSQDYFDSLYLVIAHEYTELPETDPQPEEETP